MSVLSFFATTEVSVGTTLVSLFFVLSRSVGLFSAFSLPWQANRKANDIEIKIFFIHVVIQEPHPLTRLKNTFS